MYKSEIEKFLKIQTEGKSTLKQYGSENNDTFAVIEHIRFDEQLGENIPETKKFYMNGRSPVEFINEIGFWISSFYTESD